MITKAFGGAAINEGAELMLCCKLNMMPLAR